MNVFLLCCAYSDSQTKFYQSISKRGYQYAAQNFQSALIDGLYGSNDVNLQVLSIPSLSTYPKGCTKIWISNSEFTYKNASLGKSFGFLNFPLLNHIHQSRIDKYIDEWYTQNRGDKVIIVYALLRQQMQYAVEAKRRHSSIKLCLIVPDLPMYMNCNKYYRKLGLQRRDMKVINSLLHTFDYYVVLAEQMVNPLMIKNKPYIVVEGIYNVDEECRDFVEKLPHKTIMYAGGIVSRYGVFDLVEAFHRIDDDNYRLILCGPCLEMDKLNNYLISDSRIEYRGLVPTDEVRELQKKVTLLVNPRHSTEEFTKYSFPSKTLEYMASGTPVLMSKLPSMPNEYKQYMYLFDDESIEGMRQQIENVCSLDHLVLMEKGRKAKEFILHNKSPKSQVTRIIKLIQ